MRIRLCHGLLVLGIFAAEPLFAETPRRPRLGSIVPCEGSAETVQPGPPWSAPPAELRATFGVPTALEPGAAFHAPAAAHKGVRPASQQEPEIPFPPREMPSGPLAAPSETYTPQIMSTPVAAGDYMVGDGFSPYPPGPALGRLWIIPEFLYWQVQGQQVPALVTAAPLGATLPGAGTLGDPNTRIIFGASRLVDAWRPGMRLRGGFWFDGCQSSGIDASGFFLGQGSESFHAGFNGDPGVFRPFFNAGGTPNSELIAFQDPLLNPGILTPVVAGQVVVHAANTLYGFDVNYRRLVFGGMDGRVDLLVGYRHLGTSDTVTISESVVATNPNPPPGFPLPGTIIVGRDYFHTTDSFHGGQLGLTGEKWRGLWYVSWTGKVALGNTQRVTTIDGFTQIFPSTGGSAAFTGGLLAQGSNIGRHSSNIFSAIPELGLNVGRQLTPRLRVFAGYTFLYWTNLWRAGDQIDLVLTQVPPAVAPPTAHPAFPGNSSSMWVQGVSFGAEFRY